MSAIITMAPETYNHSKPTSIFLAGSIDMGEAEEWQSKVCDELKDLDIQILNPRRDDFDSSWKQDISDKNFSEQVNWELDALNMCDFVLFYFDKHGKAPITLMELGLKAAVNKPMIVCCPEGYWRRGNVQIVCNRNNIDMVDNFDSMISYTRGWIKHAEY